MGLRHTALVCLLAMPPLALSIPTSVGPVCPLAWGTNDVASWALGQGASSAAYHLIFDKHLTGLDLYCMNPVSLPSHLPGMSPLSLRSLQDNSASLCQSSPSRLNRHCLSRASQSTLTSLLLLLPRLAWMLLQLCAPYALFILGKRLLHVGKKNRAPDLLTLAGAYLTAAVMLTRLMLLSMLPSLLRPPHLPQATRLSSLLIYTPLLLPPLANLHVTFGVRRLSLQMYSMVAMLPSLLLLAYRAAPMGEVVSGY